MCDIENGSAAWDEWEEGAGTNGCRLSYLGEAGGRKRTGSWLLEDR